MVITANLKKAPLTSNKLWKLLTTLFPHHFFDDGFNFLSIRFAEIISIAAVGWPVFFAC